MTMSSNGIRKTLKKNNEATFEAEDEEEYGCCYWKPRCLQCFNSIRVNVLWQCVFAFCEGFITNGVISAVIPALEKRYELSSQKSGLIPSSNDFGGFFTYIAVGYIGEHRHKPRIMAAGIILMSLGSLIFALPQFIGDKYEYTVSAGNQSENICKMVDEANVTSTCSEENVTGYYAMFIIGPILMGVGSSPMFTLGLSYIDENCKPKLTAMYLSWTFCIGAIGVAVGFIVGGLTLEMFVDINSLDPSSVPLTPKDPQWVGAWWIGIISATGAFILVALPILGYPKRLPGYSVLQKQRKSETQAGLEEQIKAKPEFGKNLKDFPKAMWILLKNPTYLFICLAGISDALLVGAFAAFGPKIIQERFNIELSMAGIVMGVLIVPGSGGGMILGGYLVKRFDLKCRAILRMCAAFSFGCMLVAPVFLTYCPGKKVAGIDTGYMGLSTATGLEAVCNMGCGCNTEGFEPLCVDNNNIYFSPCHAGCTTVNVNDDQKTYHNCNCLSRMIDVAGNTSSVRQQNETDYRAVPGDCSGLCPQFYVFCVFFFFGMVCLFTTMSPAVTASMRCVPHQQRSLAIATQHLILRLLGTTPGPVLLGTIIDSSCNLWQMKCGKTGSCWIYDDFEMGIRIMVWFLVLKATGVTFYLIAGIVYKAPADADENVDKNADGLSYYSATSRTIIGEEVTKL